MRAFRLLVVRRIRQAPVRAATTVLSVAAGVALAVSITVLLASIDRSLADFGRGLAGPAPIRISGTTLRGGLPEDVLPRAAAVEGVRAVVPMVQSVARVQSEPGGPLAPALALGLDCRAEALVGPIGCDGDALPAAGAVLARGPDVPAGAQAVLRGDAGPVPLGEAPVVPELASVADGRAVLLPLPEAQRAFLRPGQVDVAYVLTTPGADVSQVQDGLRRAVGDRYPVLAATAAPGGAGALLGGALPIFSMLGLFALGIGGVLVANTAAMALETRRRELAVVGALGGRPRTVVLATMAEMGVLGAAGGLLGTLGGIAVAMPIVGSFSAFTEEVTGASLTTHVPASAFVTGVVLGTVVGAGAALLPARRAVRMDVAAELSGREATDATRPPRLGRRTVVWSLVAGAGLAGCWVAQRDGGLAPWQATIVQPAFLVTTIACLLATVALAPLLVERLGRTGLAGASATWRLALNAARRDHRRTGLLAVTVGAAVVTAFVTEGSSASARASIEATVARSGDGVDVSTMPFDDDAGPDLTPDLVDALAAVPGVERVHRGTVVITGMADDPLLVLATSHNPLVLDVIDGEASEERLAAGEVLIGPGLARTDGIRAGDHVRVPTPTGDRMLPVQGVWEEGSNLGRNVTMSPELVEELFGPQPASFVALSPADGVSETELGARVEAAGLHPELRTRSSAELADAIADEVDGQFGAFRVMQQALLAVLFAAVLSSLLLAAVQRRRELGLLAAVGADPPSVARLLLAEAGIVALAGLVISFAIGPVMMFALNQVLPFVIGFRNPLAFEWWVLVQAGAIATAVALLAAAWPARRAARVEVLEALRYE